MDHSELKEPGLYIHLYHGFASEEARQEADDWGADGPIIGPLKSVHTTYAAHIKCELACDTTSEYETFYERFANLQLHYYGSKSRPECFDMMCVDDCLFVNGMYYGDWIVFYYAGF